MPLEHACHSSIRWQHHLDTRFPVQRLYLQQIVLHSGRLDSAKEATTAGGVIRQHEHDGDVGGLGDMPEARPDGRFLPRFAT